MHVLFVHQQYPAQFGHVARRLVADYGWRCTFLTRAPARNDAGVRVVRYGAKTEPAPASHPYVRHFEADVRQAEAVHAYCRNTRLRPDLVVGHSGFGSTIFLRELFDCPIVNYFEYFYRTKDSDFDFRPDVPTTPEDAMRARARNAMTLLDLANCDAGYTPTAWQRGLFPAELRRKIRVIPDGIDTELWRRRPATRRFGGRPIAVESKIVTYVARGLESMRGFDVFMQVARRIAARRADVVFVVVGGERGHYGDDARLTGGATFKQHVLERDRDLSRFRFIRWLEPERLAELFSASDLHIYLTVPFVLSWSLLDAMACGCVVLASDTAPVRDVIRDGETGLLAGFFDVERLAARALDVLREPAAYRRLGRAAERSIKRRHGLDGSVPRLAAFFEQVRRRGTSRP